MPAITAQLQSNRPAAAFADGAGSVASFKVVGSGGGAGFNPYRHPLATTSRGLEAGGRTVQASGTAARRLIAEWQFAKKLKPDDEIVIEATGNTNAILLSPFVSRVVISNPILVRAIAWAKVKTDKIDAATLAKLRKRATGAILAARGSEVVAVGHG